MEQCTVKCYGWDYKIFVSTIDDGNLILNILDPAGFLGAIVKYIPCGYNRYDYEIIINNNMDENTIAFLMEEFNYKVVEA